MKEITFDDINKAIATVANLTTVPDPNLFPNHGDHEVIDEDKSVRWNREEIARRNEAYLNEKRRLRNEYVKAQSAVTETYIKYIAQEANVSEAKARIMYSYVYEIYRLSMGDLYDGVNEFIDMYNDLQKVD